MALCTPHAGSVLGLVARPVGHEIGCRGARVDNRCEPWWNALKLAGSRSAVAVLGSLPAATPNAPTARRTPKWSSISRVCFLFRLVCGMSSPHRTPVPLNQDGALRGRTNKRCSDVKIDVRDTML